MTVAASGRTWTRLNPFRARWPGADQPSGYAGARAIIPAGAPWRNPPQRMPASISGTSAPMVCGVTTPAPVFTEMPGIL